MTAPPGYVRPDYAQCVESSDGPVLAAGGKKAKDLSAAAMSKAMQIAWSPGRSLFSFVIMMFMIGNKLTVFSIFFLIPVLTGPITQIMNVNQAFAALEGMKVNLTQPKLLYFALSCVGLALGVYKVHSMGLLPVTSSDWVHILAVPTPAETSVPAAPLV